MRCSFILKKEIIIFLHVLHIKLHKKYDMCHNKTHLFTSRGNLNLMISKAIKRLWKSYVELMKMAKITIKKLGE